MDFLRLERSADGTLHVFIGDMKSTVEVKVEHRLQVAFYRLMLERIFKDTGINHNTIQTGILYRPPADPTPEDEEEIKSLRNAAKHVFGLTNALLEIIADQEAYLQSAHDLLLGKESTARRVAGTSIEAIPYCLSFKCDGCLYKAGAAYEHSLHGVCSVMHKLQETEGLLPITTEQIDAILPFLDRFEAAGFSAGSWKMPEGQFPWFDFNEVVMEFHKALYDNGWATPAFDWTEWQDSANGEAGTAEEAVQACAQAVEVCDGA